VVAGAVCVSAQELSPPDDSRHSMLREAIRGLLSAQAGVPATWAAQHCLDLPALKHGQVGAVWHARFETGASAVWRSVTPELASMSQSTTLLSVMSCLNGTGGCGQEFLQRYPDGQWAAVWQVWLDQLPHGFADRIRHGVRIDPSTLRGEAGFYAEGDANCCPSQRLVVQLALHGDTLVLSKHAVLEEHAQ